jgi:eukaryotic-like serine/threonine-protein kinase
VKRHQKSMKAAGIFQFGEFQIDALTRTLRRDEATVSLSSRAFDVLLYFVENPGKILTREEVLKNVWAEAFVDENTLVQSISALRRALNEKPGDNSYIVTLPGRGYQFVAPVRIVSPEVVDPEIINPEIIAAENEKILPAPEASARSESGGLVFQRHIQTNVTTTNEEREHVRSPKSRSRTARTIAALAIGATVVTSVAVGGGWYLRSYRAPKLTEKDTILVADFDNRTGDPVFDDTLKQALTVGLDQSPYLNVISDRKIGEGLKLMGRDSGQRFTGEVARDLCQRVSGNALLQGSIASFGSQYVVVLSVTNCATGNSLAAEQVRAESKEKILPALDKAASNLRGKLGESVGSIEKYDTPMEQATTPSLAALQAYSAGVKIWATQGNDAAIPFYKRAIELDPNFAMAYARLGQAYNNLYVQGAAIENSKKSFTLRDGVSERERFYIDSRYYDTVTGESEREVRVLEQWRQVYPREWYPAYALARDYLYLGRYDDALRLAREELRLEPGNENNYTPLLIALLSLNRFDEAQAILQARSPEFPKVSFAYTLAFLRGDAEGMQTQTVQMTKTPNGEYLFMLAETEIYHGRLRKGRELIRQAVELESGDKERRIQAAGWEGTSAWQEAILGYPDRARHDVTAALTLSRDTTNTGVDILAAMALALIGDSGRPETTAAEMAKQYPVDTMVNSYALPTIQAAIQLSHNHPVEAVQDLEVTSRYELQRTNVPPLIAVYLRGQALLAMHQGHEAAAEFQKFIDHPGRVANNVLGPLARVGLARAYAMQGDTIKARAAYEDFFNLWKDADPDIPILKQAKAEYAKLQ